MLRRDGTRSFAADMHRFFIRQPITETVTLNGDDVKHITRVLRLRAGDIITLCDGHNHECTATLETITKDAVLCRCNTPKMCETEPKVRVTLFQGLPKTGKMETIIQKCVELGIDTVVPMQTEFCVVQPKESFKDRIDRWQRVAEEAAKQCRRGIIPKVGSLMKLSAFDASLFDLCLVAYENERCTTLKEALRGFKGTTIAILIGPEGGFSQAEIERLEQNGIQSVSLGKRILRTETAGMSMLAQIMYEVEE